MTGRTLIALITAVIVSAPFLNAADPVVRIMDIPEGGIQPKLVRDDAGTVHLVYYRGKDDGGDLFYTRKELSREFTKPVLINSIPRSAIAAGTIRGAQIAVGRNHRVSVVWNSSNVIDERSKRGPSMFFARSNDDGTGFEPQRTISGDWSVDGGGAVTADREGHLYVLWHSAPAGKTEDDRRMFLKTSTDDGITFQPETVISPSDRGVCPCCAMQALVDREGNLYVVFRAARNAADRDITLLTSTNHGVSFQHSTVARWRVESCPMSSMAFTEIPTGVLAAWETQQQVYFGMIKRGTAMVSNITAPPGQAPSRKHPAFAPTFDGGFLFAWTEHTGWKKGGSMAWQLFDASLNPVGELANAPGVAMWSFISAYAAEPDHYVIVR